VSKNSTGQRREKFFLFSNILCKACPVILNLNKDPVWARLKTGHLNYVNWQPENELSV
jgi:hypothetical protein